MPGFRPQRIVIHPDVARVYERLEAEAKLGQKEESAIWKAFRTALSRIRNDGQWGEVIPRIPPYFRKYGALNLYCVDLAFFHRAFYTILHRDVIFLDLVDHEQYSRWFSGRLR